MNAAPPQPPIIVQTTYLIPERIRADLWLPDWQRDQRVLEVVGPDGKVRLYKVVDRELGVKSHHRREFHCTDRGWTWCEWTWVDLELVPA